MKLKLLVAYATTYGATREVAEKIASTAENMEAMVDVQPASEIQSLSDYQAVILGTGLYLGHVHRDAHKFLSKFQPAFADGTPLAIFAGGPLQPEDDCSEIRQMLDADLVKFSEIKPLAVELIGGKYDPEKLRFPWTMLPAMKNIPACDLRDWDSINQWAINVVNQFKHALVKDSKNE